MNFRESLIEQLESTPSLRRRGKRILAILNGPATRRRERIVARMERQTRVVMNIKDDVEVDWSKVDWKAVIEIVLKFLLALLPFLL